VDIHFDRRPLETVLLEFQAGHELVSLVGANHEPEEIRFYRFSALQQGLIKELSRTNAAGSALTDMERQISNACKNCKFTVDYERSILMVRGTPEQLDITEKKLASLSIFARSPGDLPPRNKQHQAGAMDPGRGQPNFNARASGAIISLSSDRAGALAKQLANERAQTLCHCQPFTTNQPAWLVGGLWHWRERRAYGHADLEANVSFSLDGSTPIVQVLLLDSTSLREF
jgi:hypothetical protein